MNRRAGFFLLVVALLAVGASAPAAKAPRRPARAVEHTLTKDFADAYLRTARIWSHEGKPGSHGRDLAKPIEDRTVAPLDLAGLTFLARADTLRLRRDESFDPREAIYSTFQIGSDTLRFTYGIMAEAFRGMPRLEWSAPGVPRRPYPLAPLEYWNVDEVWFTGNAMIFGCTRESDGPLFEQIAIWDWKTGRWWTSPRESALAHRGFKLREILPDWRAAQVALQGASYVLKSTAGTLILSPAAGTWALFDPAGHGVVPMPHRVARQFVPVTDDVHRRLRAPLLAAFRESNAAVDSVVVLEVLQGPCLGHSDDAAVLAMGLARPPTVSAVDSPDIRATLNSQLFGIFMVDRGLSAIRSRVDLFPTSRYGDYVIYFDTETPDNTIVIWGQGQTYGDEQIQRGYTCGN